MVAKGPCGRCDVHFCRKYMGLGVGTGSCLGLGSDVNDMVRIYMLDGIVWKELVLV